MNTDRHRLERILVIFAYLCASVFICGKTAFAEDKPRVAVFPFSGDAADIAREKAGFAIRSKIDREGTYEVIDGPTMLDLAGETKISFDTKLADVEELAKLESPTVLIWGELLADRTLRVKVFDQRQLDPLPHQFQRKIAQPTDLRFVIEAVVSMLADVKAFEHPNEVAVQKDPAADRLWETNPNLVVNGTFDQAANWSGIFQAEYYPVKFSDALPEREKIVIYRMPVAGEHPNHVLAMNLTRYAAENNGMACLSDAIKIEPDTRYRVSFRYKSDGPKLHVFIKGYTKAADVSGKLTEREIYRRQVPPTGATDGQWVTVVDELNPQHTAFPVQYLKVDLYAYLHEGAVMFDDVVLKAVGPQNRVAKDKALKPPATRPTGTK